MTSDSVTLHNNDKLGPILNHFEKQFTRTCVGLSNLHEIIGGNLDSHGLKC